MSPLIFPSDSDYLPSITYLFATSTVWRFIGMIHIGLFVLGGGALMWNVDRQTDGQCVFYIHHSRKKTRWKTQFLELFTHIVKCSLNGNGFLKHLTTKHPNVSHRVCFCQGDCFFMTLCIVLYCSVFRYIHILHIQCF